MFINNIFNIIKKDIVSIVGSGGKTSLMFRLAKEFKHFKHFNVLLSTTTKIYTPETAQCDALIVGGESFAPPQGHGVYVLGKCYDETDAKATKIVGYDTSTLPTIANRFDLSIIESDGAKGKVLKGWKSHEPVVLKETTKTIGVITLSQIGKEICEENIHNSHIFRQNFANAKDKSVKMEHIKNAILHKDGLFKDAVSDRILFINQIDDEQSEQLARGFLNTFTKGELQHFEQIVYGSVEKERYFEYEKL